MTNADLYKLRHGLQVITNSNLKGVKFAYAIAKNSRIVGKEVEYMEKGKEPSKEYQKFDKERLELCKTWSKKDKDNKPVMVSSPNGQQEFSLTDHVAFEAALDELREEHKEAVDEHEKKNEEFLELVKMDIDAERVKLYTFPMEYVPDDVTPGQLEGIFDLIQEKKPESDAA